MSKTPETDIATRTVTTLSNRFGLCRSDYEGETIKCVDVEVAAKLEIERDQLRKVADELANRILNVRPIVREDGTTNDWLDCHIDEMLRGYNSLPHVIERNKSK